MLLLSQSCSTVKYCDGRLIPKKGGLVTEKKLDENMIFAALKLIEQLNHDGYLPGFIFKNILNEYYGKVDITEFKIKENKGD